MEKLLINKKELSESQITAVKTKHKIVRETEDDLLVEVNDDEKLTISKIYHSLSELNDRF